jgi:hypothetical protein
MAGHHESKPIARACGCHGSDCPGPSDCAGDLSVRARLAERDCADSLPDETLKGTACDVEWWLRPRVAVKAGDDQLRPRSQYVVIRGRSGSWMPRPKLSLDRCVIISQLHRADSTPLGGHQNRSDTRGAGHEAKPLHAVLLRHHIDLVVAAERFGTGSVRPMSGSTLMVPAGWPAAAVPRRDRAAGAGARRRLRVPGRTAAAGRRRR